MTLPPTPSKPPSSWPVRIALLCWLLLMCFSGALLFSQYQLQQKDIQALYQARQDLYEQRFQGAVERFRRQTLSSLASLRAETNPPSTGVDNQLNQWWNNHGHTRFLSVRWLDERGQTRWHQGSPSLGQQDRWFEQQSQTPQAHTTLHCEEERCEELAVQSLFLNDHYVGELRTRRSLDQFLLQLADTSELQLGVLDAQFSDSQGWQAQFFAIHELQQKQLIPFADPNLLRQLRQAPSTFPQLTDDHSVWSLLSFPRNYVDNLHLITRAQPFPVSSDFWTKNWLWVLLCTLISTALALLVWSFFHHINTRIGLHTELLPLLAEKKYRQLRERLLPQKDSIWIKEFSSMEESLNTLSYQLESLDKAVDVRNQEMERLSLFDSLSGLPNRHLLQYEIQNDLRELRQHNREGVVAVLLLDLDKFKRINDSLGHQLGDSILEKMGKRLKGNIRSLGVVARLGGDEFAILLRSVKRVDQLQTICQKILDLVNKPLEIDDTTLVLSCSIGVSVASVGDTYNDVLKHAEIAMYKAKDNGGNNYRLFNAEMASEADMNLSMEGEIRRGFSEEEFTLYLQPKVSMDGIIKGFESLVRWDHPDRGTLPPGEFIPAMENMGFISQLDNWVLEASCRQLKVLETHYPDVSIAVNISSTHFTDQKFLVFLQNCLTKYPINPNKLELEITETLLMENMSAGREVIDKIKQLGVRIAIDDFGTGYSSLSYLKKLPVDTLKIDREFIKDIPDSESDMQISSVIIFLAKQLQFSVVAEGVETSEQLVFLKASHCDLAQGFYFSKPIPAHKAILMLESERIDLSSHQQTG